ncbi:hypothetical protein C8R45DRAFT_1174224 [Mycena sanguinolenta]|nr:hypothetical protein C8R45DRAFT_1174224 [Mycena sanguinolenta]
MSVEQEQEDLAITLINLGQIGVVMGASKQDVLQNLEMAKAILISTNHFTGSFYYEIMLADLELREGDMLGAKNRFEKCLHWSWTGDTQVTSFCLEKMSDIGRWGPAYHDWAATSATVYLAFVLKMKQKLGVYNALCSLGDMFLSNGDELTAESLFTITLEAFTYMDVHRRRADCMSHLGDIAAQRGDILRAKMWWRDARPLFERSLQSKDIMKMDMKLGTLESA